MSRTESLTQYWALLAALADPFDPDDHGSIRSLDLRALTDDELATVLNHDESAGDDAYAPRVCAEIYNSVLYVTHHERVQALGKALDEGILRNVREKLAQDVNTYLWEQSEAVGNPAERAMDEAGMSARDFA